MNTFSLLLLLLGGLKPITILRFFYNPFFSFYLVKAIFLILETGFNYLSIFFLFFSFYATGLAVIFIFYAIAAMFLFYVDRTDHLIDKI